VRVAHDTSRALDDENNLLISDWKNEHKRKTQKARGYLVRLTALDASGVNQKRQQHIPQISKDRLLIVKAPEHEAIYGDNEQLRLTHTLSSA